MPAASHANPQDEQVAVSDSPRGLALALFAALMLFPVLAQFMPLPLRQYLAALFR